MSLRVAVVGATGVVGTTMLKLLGSRGFPASEVVPFATGWCLIRHPEGDRYAYRFLRRIPRDVHALVGKSNVQAVLLA